MLTTTATVLACPIVLLRADEIPHPERAVARAEVIRVRRAVYADAAAWRALAPWDRYLARVHAVRLTHPDAPLCHEAASVLLGMGVVGDPRTVHVVGSSASASRESSGIRTHAMTGAEIIEVGDALVTSPRATAVTLARHRHHAIGLAAADAALRVDPSLGREHLVGLNEAGVNRRGRDVARWPLAHAAPLAETVLESVSRALVLWLGFPAPELQREFRMPDGREYRGDLWWPHSRLLGEVDGEVKYDGSLGDPVDSLRRRRRRDAELRQHHVRAVAHWGWAESARVDPVRTLLAGHGLVAERPEDPVRLHSLRRALSPIGVAETATGRRDLG